MKSVYYIANSIYQFAYALPVYQLIGGIFVVPNEKKAKQFCKYMRGEAIHSEQNNGMTPDLIIRNRYQLGELNGILFFLANTIVPEQSYSNAVTIFHEHGTSDKLYEGGQEIAIHKLRKYDYIFLSGPKNKHRMLDIGMIHDENRWIPAGAPRMSNKLPLEMKRHQYRSQLGIEQDNRPIVLYAPTWKFGNGSLKSHLLRLAIELNRSYHLIVRPHYHDRRVGKWMVLLLRMFGYKKVYYSDPTDIIHHDTYAAFAASDILISDFSSVVYEYLWMRNPIILIDTAFKHRHTPHNEYSIYNLVPTYSPTDHWAELIQRELNNRTSTAANMELMLQQCFYFPAGGSVSFMAEFINKLR